jgi:hypothetical protein
MPIDRGTLNQQLDALGGSATWWNERELRDLPTILQQDEQILAIARGRLARWRLTLRRSRLIVVTDRRLVCIRSDARAGWRQVEVGADQIRRVALRIGPFKGRVIVQTAGATFRLLLARSAAYDVHRMLEGIIPQVMQVAGGLGARRVVRRVVDHILAFPAAALDPDVRRPALPQPRPDPAVVERMSALEEETEELRSQVAFLEQLLRERQAGARLREPVAQQGS